MLGLGSGEYRFGQILFSDPGVFPLMSWEFGGPIDGIAKSRQSRSLLRSRFLGGHGLAVQKLVAGHNRELCGKAIQRRPRLPRPRLENVGLTGRFCCQNGHGVSGLEADEFSALPESALKGTSSWDSTDGSIPGRFWHVSFRTEIGGSYPPRSSHSRQVPELSVSFPHA